MAQKLLTDQSVRYIVVVLRLLGNDYPAIQQDVETLIDRLHKRFGYRGAPADERAILKAIRNGYATASEISEKTGVPYVTVTKRLAELEADGIVTTTRAPYVEGRGGDRSTQFYWLADRWKELFKQRRPRPQAVQVRLFD